MKRILIYLIPFIALTASCDYKELCYEHPHGSTTRIRFDWKNIPDANPEGMAVLFFPEAGGKAQRYDFIGKEGGDAKLMVGNYLACCGNNDFEYISLKGDESAETFEVTSNIADTIIWNLPKETQFNDQKKVLQVDMLWGENRGLVDITVRRDHEVVMTPVQAVSKYTYEIRNVENLKYARDVKASLSGMSESLFPMTGKMSPEPAVVCFEPSAISRNDKGISGSFNTFGYNAEIHASNIFTAYFWMSDGKKYYYQFDVTEQVKKAIDPLNVHIVISGIELPKPITNGGGFTPPTVDEWETENVDIDM